MKFFAPILRKFSSRKIDPANDKLALVFNSYADFKNVFSQKYYNKFLVYFLPFYTTNKEIADANGFRYVELNSVQYEELKSQSTYQFRINDDEYFFAIDDFIQFLQTQTTEIMVLIQWDFLPLNFYEQLFNEISRPNTAWWVAYFDFKPSKHIPGFIPYTSHHLKHYCYGLDFVLSNYGVYKDWKAPMLHANSLN